nr:hypothetical protein [Tannerella forsythia]
MNSTRTVAGLDVHKDSIYLCIMGYDQGIIWENTYGVLTPDLREMHHDMRAHGVTEAAMESTAVYCHTFVRPLFMVNAEQFIA